VLLIASQCQGATRVAGFNAWRKLNRFVRKGERAIWILAPMLYRNTDASDGENDRVIRGFRFVPVFDVTQTEGEELPSICNRLDANDQKGRYAQLLTAAQRIGFRVADHKFNGEANGDCCHAERLIRVETTNSPAQRVKTLAHELAHALLHENWDNRALAELEAESTAYIVCQQLGIDSGDYSFGYLATWAGDGNKAIAAIRSSCERIQKSAAVILQTFELEADDEAA
jgi:antirestriction protein ArdC